MDKNIVKICQKDVENALRMVQPKLLLVDLKNYKSNIRNVAEFLITTKGNHKKWFLTMGVDYFNCLLDYYKGILKLPGFRVGHIDSDLAKDLFIQFLENKGSFYWNELIETNTIKTDSGKICKKVDAEPINMDKIKGNLKEKYGHVKRKKHS